MVLEILKPVDDVVSLEDKHRAIKENYVKNAVIFTQPIPAGEVVFFRIKRTSPYEFKKGVIGFTAEDPATLQYDAFLRKVSAISCEGVIVINTTNANKPDSNIHCAHFEDCGTVFYGLNGVLEGTVNIPKPNGKMWMFVVMGSLSEIEIISNPVPPNTFKEYKEKSSKLQKRFNNLMSSVHESQAAYISTLPQIDGPMVFHTTRLNITTSNNRKAAEPLDLHSNVAFLSKPIQRAEVVSLEANDGGSLLIAVTSKNPQKLSENDLSKNYTVETFGTKDDILIGEASLVKDDVLQIALVDPNGSAPTLIFGVNGVAKHSKRLPNNPYYWIGLHFNTVMRVNLLEVLLSTISEDEPLNSPSPTKKEETGKKVRIGEVVEVKEASTVSSDSTLADNMGNPANPKAVEDGQLSMTTIFDRILDGELTRIKKLGNGAQGDVYLVSNPLLGRVSAKFFKNPKITKYERREIEIMAKLNTHRFIISVYGFIYSHDLSTEPTGFVMEYMENGSLFEAIHDLKRNPDKTSSFKIYYHKHHIYNWLQQAASAFHFMHSNGVIHRDIKPMNILLTNEYQQLRVCDLGLSGTIQLDMTLRIGTYLYMAPELLRTMNTRDVSYDGKVDVYSLGILIWELLHRRLPYYKESCKPMQLMMKVVEDHLRPTIRPDIGQSSLVTLMKKCWSPIPSERPTMLEICQHAHGKLTALDQGDQSVDLRVFEK